MSGAGQRRRCGGATADFMLFFGVFGLVFVVGSLTLVPRIYGVDPAWIHLLRVPDLADFDWELEPPGALAWWRAESEPASPPPTRYEVAPGDTLSKIAQAHSVLLEDLIAVNELETPDALLVGQVLRIPGTAPALPQPAPPPDFTTVDELIARADEKLRAARFDATLDLTTRATRLLATDPDSPGAAERRVRVELLRAEAHAAFGDASAALASFDRALELDPTLALDPDRTSPKLLRILDRARFERRTRVRGEAPGSAAARG